MLRCREKYGEGEESRKSEQSRNNPFFFDEDSFRTALRAQEGNLRVLERFLDRSNFLRGIENFRLAVLEANPNSALIPTHSDTEQILFVVAGSATITLLLKENRESYNLRRGDILTVHAGTTLYIINIDNNEKLFIAKLLETISVPGQAQEFFGVGGRDQESFYMSFTKDILEAAFNGSMSAPYYNSKAIKVALVVDGKGYVEIVSPYVSDRSRQGREEEREESVSYQRLSAQLSDGQGFIVLAGHPFVVVADHGQDLRVLCFDIKIATVKKNEKYPLAGRDNIYNEMNRAEKEMFFKESEREVEQVLKGQKEAGFFDVPQG